MKNLLLLSTTLILFMSSTLLAQTNKGSYLYLEVNKDLPVDIKLNQRKIENNRKGYIIIPRLEPGENTIEFNFANPNFRKHSFKVESTDSKSMGLKLMRVSDNRFVLQDVVNKKIINDETTLSAEPIVTIAQADPVKKSVTTEPERGIVKVYTAETTQQATEVQKTLKQKKADKEKKIVPVIKEPIKQIEISPLASTPDNEEPARELAMYKNRKPLTPQTRANRYKDYGKLRRANKRAARNKAKQTVAQETTTEKGPAPTPKENREPKEPKAAKEKNTPTADNTKAQLKEAKRIEKETRKKEMLEKERLEYKRLEEERAANIQNRIDKKNQRKQQEADINETKKEINLPKKKPYEKEFKNIDEKIINSEPTGKQSAKQHRKDYTEQEANRTSSARCNSSAKAERIAEWTLKLPKKFDDEARTNYIRKKLGGKCISTENLGVVLSNLNTQIGRYKLIRTLYPNLEDPSNLDKFDKYFQSKSYIDKIKELNLNNY